MAHLLLPLCAPVAAAALWPAQSRSLSSRSLPGRRSVIFGATAAALTPSTHSARAEGDTVANPTNFKGFNLFGEGSAERCENGQGAACERLAEGSELILKLQKQSVANREKNAKQLYEQTVRNLNYGEFFDALDKNLVQLPSGKFAAYDAEEYTRLRKEGKIKIGAFDQLIDPDAPSPQSRADSTAGAAAGAAAGGAVSLDYAELVAAIKKGGVEGVVFEPPRGDVALALVGGDAMARTDVKAPWKKAEVVNIMARLGVPNNYADVSRQ